MESLGEQRANFASQFELARDVDYCDCHVWIVHLLVCKLSFQSRLCFATLAAHDATKCVQVVLGVQLTTPASCLTDSVR